MSKSKKQGTEFESWLVKRFTEAGLEASRLAEGGSNDEGDIELLSDQHRIVVEAKHREQLSVHTALQKTVDKAGESAILAWKRTLRTPGNKRRSAVGPGVVISMTLDQFLRLVASSESS